MPLGDIVSAAHKLHGSTILDWNKLADAERDVLLTAELERRFAAVSPPPPPPPPAPARTPRTPRPRKAKATKE